MFHSPKPATVIMPHCMNSLKRVCVSKLLGVYELLTVSLDFGMLIVSFFNALACMFVLWSLRDVRSKI